MVVNYRMPYRNPYKTEQTAGDEQKFLNVTSVVQQITVNTVVILGGNRAYVFENKTVCQ